VAATGSILLHEVPDLLVRFGRLSGVERWLGIVLCDQLSPSARTGPRKQLSLAVLNENKVAR
jgi:hypothetical protein